MAIVGRLPLLVASALRNIKPSRSLYVGGHGQADVMDVKRKSVKRIWRRRSLPFMLWVVVDKFTQLDSGYLSQLKILL